MFLGWKVPLSWEDRSCDSPVRPARRSTFQVSNRSRFYPRPSVASGPVSAVGQAGGVLLTETIRAAGLDVGLSTGLARWRRPGAVHDPGKVLLDLAVSLALGGDCLADVAVLRVEAGVFGSVASDPTVSRTITALAADVPAALVAISTARAAARSRVWAAAGVHAPDHDTTVATPLVIDLDATLVTSHSEKEAAAPTFKRGFGFHPLCAFVDHGVPGTGEMVAVQLRPGNAGSNTAIDHIAVTRAALAQLPGHQAGRRPGRKVLIRTDGAGSSHAFLDWLTTQRLSYSVGFALPNNTSELLAMMDHSVWDPGLQCRRPHPGGGVGRRAHRDTQPERVAEGDEGHRPHRTPAPRGAAADHRPRRTARHRLRHQQHPRAAPRPGAAPPAPSEGGGPDPVREGHRAEQPGPCTPWPRTTSGAPSSPWPRRSPPGCSSSP